MRVSVESASAPSDVAFVEVALSEYNLRFAPPDGYQTLNAFARADTGSVVAGLLGETYWYWLHIRVLWVHESHRGAGLASRLLEAAEHEAIDRGCRHAHLDTLDFQAESFYMRHGYHVFGVLEDLPQGHRRIFMKKELRGMPSPA